MAKTVRSYRISPHTDALLKAEAERLTSDLGKRTSEADVIEMAVAAWLADATPEGYTELDAVGPPSADGKGKATTAIPQNPTVPIKREKQSPRRPHNLGLPARPFRGPLLKPKDQKK